MKIGYCFGSPEVSLGFICVAILIAGMLGVERGALHALGNYCTTELCPLPRGLGIFVCFQRQSPAVWLRLALDCAFSGLRSSPKAEIIGYVTDSCLDLLYLLLNTFPPYN